MELGLFQNQFLNISDDIAGGAARGSLWPPHCWAQVIGLTRPLAKAAGKVDARDVLWRGAQDTLAVLNWESGN